MDEGLVSKDAVVLCWWVALDVRQSESSDKGLTRQKSALEALYCGHLTFT